MIVTETNFEQATLFRKGKVRDVYDLGDKLLLIATDRISAYDVVIPTPIPDKGRILTQLSLFWFELTKNIVENHFISGNVADLPQQFHRYAAELEGRMMLTKKCTVVPFECVVRGYLVGSGWSEYKKTGTVCGI